jgi:hypothetical protein
MSVVIDGTTGVSGVSGSASTPALQGEDSNTGMFFPAADTVAVATGGSERMRVDSSGNLGLGVTPSAWSGLRALEVPGAFYGSNTSGTGYYTGHNTFYNGSQWIYKNTAAAAYHEVVGNSFRWYNAPSGTAGNAITFTQAMTLDASGNLGVGTSSPAVKLHVSSGATDEVARFEGTGNPYISLYDSGTRTGYFYSGPAVIEIGCEASKIFQVVVNGAVRLTLDGSGNLTATANVTAYSDARLKKDLDPIADALEKVQSLTGYTYTRIDSGERHTGLIAQEVQKVLPEAVMDNGEHLSLAYGNMVGLLIEAIKAQQLQIDELRAKLEG